MSKASEWLFGDKREKKTRKATMTSRSHFILERKLLLKASGAKSLQARADLSHARIWNKREIKKQFTRQYMEEQLAEAQQQSQWLRLTLKRAKGGNH